MRIEVIFALRIPIISRTNGPHASRIRPTITVDGAFVITRRRQHPEAPPANERMDRALAPAQQLFDYDTTSSLTEDTVFHHRVNGLSSGRAIVNCAVAGWLTPAVTSGIATAPPQLVDVTPPAGVAAQPAGAALVPVARCAGRIC